MARTRKPERPSKAKAAGRPTEPKTIDEYLQRLRPDQRAVLEKLRQTIRKAVPEAEESISYHMPTFKLDGKHLVYFAAAANHCALYGVEDPSIPELAGYETSGRGTIRFTVDNPLPASLVRKLLKARIARMRRK